MAKKLGRNDPCHCGSGKKYKNCHLNRDQAARRAIHRPPQASPPHVLEAAMRKHTVKEAVRESQQGKGKPIISTEFKGQRVVAVGNTLYWSPAKSTQTFVDFLNNYIRQILDPAWGNAELKKPAEERHPIILWYQEVATLQQKHAGKSGELFSTPRTGAVNAYTCLAYNLFLLKHNAEVQEHLLARLKNPDSFFGGYYETYVAAWFILAGFTLELENEMDPTTTHCEFTATAPSGEKYSVEAKTRGPNKDHLAIGNQLHKALLKKANHKRIIFIEMNLPMTTDFSKDAYMDEIVKRVRGNQDKVYDGQQLDAYVIVTNIPYHLHLQEENPIPLAIVGEGYNSPDFGTVEFKSFIDAYRAREKHASVIQVMDAAVEYKIPETFDGELPEFARGNATRLEIGEKYQFDDGRVGTLRQGLVLESSQEIVMVIESDGQQMMYRGKMSDDELAAYRKHPATFFGEVSNNGGQQKAETPFELFMFFYRGYRETPRDKILKLLNSAHDIDELKSLPTDELRLIYAERITHSALARSQKRPPRPN